MALFRGKRRTTTASNLDFLRNDIDTDVDKLQLDELLKSLNVDLKHGLTTARANELLREHGPNALTPSKKSPEIFKLIRCCCGGFSLLIWVGSFLCFGSSFLEYSTYGEASQDHLWLGMVLIVLIMVTGMFSFYQEHKSSRIMESFKQMLPQRTKVLRDLEKKELYVTELVVGDIVLVETGDRVPADIRILECQGTGKGVVVACGDQTVMGRVARLTSRLSSRPTPLSREIHKFMRYMSCWAIFLGVSFFGMSIAMGHDLVDSVIFLIGIIVANVPEGLLATVTVSLTLTAKRMANNNCLVKNLEAIETLGCTSVICRDKTGTWTQNKITVRHVRYVGQFKEIMAFDTWRKYSSSRGFHNLTRIASICNRAEWAPRSSQESLHPLSLNKRNVLGDASDAALLKCMEMLVKGGAEAFRSQYSKVGLISMMDPPRPSVSDAVFKCRCAGIKVITVTGDHPDTARAIAKYVGIITDGLGNDNDRRRSIVVTGDELRDFGSVQLDELIRGYPEIVFARTSPVQKLQIVESCQRLHMITAVTGDGVNDSPALKKADIEIGMGVAESDVSWQVADLILLDDNFASFVTGIEEDRRIFDNLKSSIGYTLASNVPKITSFLAFIALGIPLPVGVICVLCTDLGVNMWLAISFAYEKSESDIMSRRPRATNSDHLVSRKLIFMAYGQIGIIEAAAGFFTHLVVMAEHGFLPERLLVLCPYWDSRAINDLRDSYGQAWTYDHTERKIP